MKKGLYILMTMLCFLSGCRERRGVQRERVEVKDTVSIVKPVFISERIPSGVEARMRGVSYPEVLKSNWMTFAI